MAEGTGPVAVCVDAGTTLIKAVVFDEAGDQLLRTERPTAVSRPGPRRAEQDMDEVWDAVVASVREALHAVDRPLRLIAVTAQGDGAWPVGRDGGPTRPAVLWNDARAAPVVKRWIDDGRWEQAFRRTGSMGFAGLPHAVLTVLADEEPEAVAATAAVLTCGGWLHHRLTGRTVLDRSDAAAPWLDAATGATDPDLLELYDLGWARHLVPAVCADDDRVAPLTGRAAAELGAPAGTPVVLAPYDIAATAIGCGAVRAGQAATILGTTLCTEAVLDPGLVGSVTAGVVSGLTLPLGVGDRVLRAFPTLAGTGVLDWLAGLFGVADARAVVDLAERAAASDRDTAGPAGLHVLPYLSPAGERAPFLDPDAAGVFAGLTFDHDRADVALAVLEGLAHTVRDCLDVLPTGPDELRLCGGGAASDLWCRILADVTGVATVRTTDDEVGAKGALLVALAALGDHPDAGRAAEALVTERDRFAPDDGERARHEALHDRFLATRRALTPVWSTWRDAAVADAPDTPERSPGV